MKQKTGWGTQASEIELISMHNFFCPKIFAQNFFLAKTHFRKKIRYEPHGEQIVNGIKGAFFHMLLFLIHICSIFTGCNSAKESEPAHAPPTPARCPVYTCAHGKNSSNCSRRRAPYPSELLRVFSI